MIPANGNVSSSSSTSSGTSTSSAPVYEKQPVSTDVASKLYSVKDSVRKYITVRTSKSTDARALGKLYPGDLVYVVNVGYKWTRIVYNSQFAFVLSDCIEEYGPNLPEEGSLYTVTVPDGTTLNVREEGRKGSTVLRMIPNGAYVKVLEENDNWCKVYYEIDAIGYVMTKFITPNE